MNLPLYAPMLRGSAFLGMGLVRGTGTGPIGGAGAPAYGGDGSYVRLQDYQVLESVAMETLHWLVEHNLAPDLVRQLRQLL
jgi:hypothetical protein